MVAGMSLLAATLTTTTRTWTRLFARASRRGSERILLSKTKNTMKLVNTIAGVTLIASLSCCSSAEEAPEAKSSDEESAASLGICIIADETGPELQELGLRSVRVGDLAAAVRAALLAGTRVTVSFVVVDEDGRNGKRDEVASATFVPPNIEIPKRPDYSKLSGSIQDLEKAQREFHASVRDAMRRSAPLFRAEDKKAEVLIREAVEIQTGMVAKFAREIQRRRGRDYPHSDIVGAIGLAIDSIKGCDRRIIIFNSDCRDRVTYRDPRRTPLEEKELPTDVALIFSAPAGEPEKEKLFDGRKNKIVKVGGVHKALETAFDLGLAEPESP